MILYWRTNGTAVGIGPRVGLRTNDSYKLWLRILRADQINGARQMDYSRGHDLKKPSRLMSLSCWWSHKLESPEHFAHGT